MRIDVKKFLFIGSEDDRDQFFKRAQEAGIVHFINPGANQAKNIPIDVQQTTAAIKVLRGLPVVEQEENVATLDPDLLVKDILQLNQQNEKLLEELRVLELNMARVAIFGDFSKEDVDYIRKEGKRTVQFFCSKADLFDGQEPPNGLIYVGSDVGLDYYAAINAQPTTYERLIEIKIDHPIGELKRRKTDARLEHERIEKKLKAYAKYNDCLHAALLSKLNYHHLNVTQSYAKYVLGQSVFAIEGWAPENKLEELNRLTDRLHIHSEEIAIEPEDGVPTYLENKGLSRLGEDLVHIYDTPSHKDKDPSLWVLSCFTLFFAFIIADAGYGLVYLCLALFLRYKYPNLKGTAKRVLNLFTLLCVGCIVWGILITSFFGMTIDPDNPIRRFSLINWMAEKRAAYVIDHQDSIYQGLVKKYPDLATIKDPHLFVAYHPENDPDPVVLDQFSDNIMFELALFIGVVHLVLSCLRYSARQWHNLGWAAFLIGAYLYFPYYLNVPSLLNYVGGIDLVQGGKIGLQLMLGGISFAWIGSIFVNGWTGVFEIMTVVQVFADTLSYLRLYALGLAGAIVATTINELLGSVPLFVGVFLVIISHAVNIVLATMSGVVHGLRLNFLEWYHYSFEGGGKAFSPLKLLKKD